MSCRTLWTGLAFVAALGTSPVCGGEEPATVVAVQQPEPKETELGRAWKTLSDAESDRITRRHLQGLVLAMHVYHAAHGSFPPAVVPNPRLPTGKRLSGLVLLLPHLGPQGSGENRLAFFDEETARIAAETFKSIDLTKAWDDPVNLKVAKTVIPAFLNPRSGGFRDDLGFAVSHVALVRGSENGPDGAFPGTEGVSLSDITDGSVNTLAIGQVSTYLGPWIAEGLSTARQVNPPVKETPGSFGGHDRWRGLFATCDGRAHCIRFDKIEPKVLQALATRAARDLVSEIDTCPD